MTTTAPPALDPDKLMAFVFRAVDEVGATLNTALVVMGTSSATTGCSPTGPLTAAQLAERSGTGSHYAREWLNAQAAGGYVSYDPATGQYTLPPELVVAVTDESSPAYLPGFFQIAYGTVRDADSILAVARAGDGVGWHDHNGDVHDGCERFFRTMYNGHLIGEWLPALDGVVAKLQAGGTVADIGCGHGASTVLMAQAFPASRFHGSDYHRGVDRHRARAGEPRPASAAGSSSRWRARSRFTGTGYDLVTTFDALHDMGDPIGAARHVYESLADDGTWMIVEPAAGDAIEANLNPVGRAYYGFSTLLCTPSSLAQEVGLALGTQAGPARIKDVITSAGFTRFRIAAQTPFNNVLEVRK
jgi:hypothetical protein